MATYTIYALTDPRNSTVRYIGKTVYDLPHRLKEHLRNTSGGPEKMRWMQDLIQTNLQPIAHALESGIADESLAREREAYWIHYYLSINAPLVNQQKAPQRPTVKPHGEERWMTISEAARSLNVSAARISSLADTKRIRSEKDSINKRVRMVEYNEVKSAFSIQL